MGGQRGHHGLVGLHANHLPRAFEHHLEAADPGGRRQLGLEIFTVNPGLGPAGLAGNGNDGVHEALRAAGVEVALGRGAAQDRSQVQALRGRAVVQVQLHLVCPGHALELLGERGLLARAGAVMQLKGLAGCSQRVGHGQQGREADASGQQQAVARGLCQGELVARRADL